MVFKEQLEELVEPLARQFAAEKMALVKDRNGDNLPDDIWQQCVPQARKFLNLE